MINFYNIIYKILNGIHFDLVVLTKQIISISSRTNEKKIQTQEKIIIIKVHHQQLIMKRLSM